MWAYWKMVIKRAWRRSLELVRWESWERIVVFLIILAVTFSVSWWLIGDHNGAALRAFASLGATLIAVFCLFLWNVIKVPSVIHAEQKAEIAELAADREAQEVLKSRREALGQLLAEANELARAFCSDQQIEPIIAAVGDWLGRANLFAEHSLDGAHRALLWSDTGILAGEPTIDEARKDRWRWIYYRAIRLQEIIKTL